LIVDTEQEVRQNIVSWVEQIHQVPDLSPEAEQRLLMVMTQFIEDKFKTLSYKELANMLRLTPFKEMASYKEAFLEDLQEDRVDLSLRLIRRKFHFAEKTLNKVVLRLRQLTLKDLELLFESIFDFKSLKDLNAWIDQRLAAQATVESPDELANL